MGNRVGPSLNTRIMSMDYFENKKNVLKHFKQRSNKVKVVFIDSATVRRIAWTRQRERGRGKVRWPLQLSRRRE